METKETGTCNTCNKGWGKTFNFGLNISEKYKTFLWLWNKTGTSHMAKNLKYFGFQYFILENNTKKLQTDSIIQAHTCKLFPGHENYYMMVSARNPYTRFFSAYNFRFRKDLTIQGFKEFLEFNFESDHDFNCSTFNERLPNFYVRVENMVEDYSKIPFVASSDYFKSGLLEEFCNKKINSFDTEKIYKDFYNQSIADLVYYSCQEYFKFFGYDKNSWKK